MATDDILNEEQTCPNCGHALDDNDICQNCGAILKSEDEFGGFQDDDSAFDDEF